MGNDLEGGQGTGDVEYHFAANRWGNYLGEQGSTVDKWLEPKSCEELRTILENVSGSTRVRAVGSGHASSEVARPDDILIDLKNMKRKLSTRSFFPHPESLKEDEKLFRVEAGVTIQELNKHLDAAGLALKNMGSYDGQKFIGAACTGTHGSGLTWGPLADSVVSIEIFTIERNSSGQRRVYLRRIEPHEGLTDPARFGQGEGEENMELVVDGDLFYASVVSMGCFGIVCAMTLKVVPAYWLQEVRQEGAWSKLKHRLTSLAQEDGHVDVWIVPHRVPDAHDNACLVIRRTKCEAGRGIPERPEGAECMDCVERWLANLLTKIKGDKLGKYLSNHSKFMTRNMAGYFGKCDAYTFKSVSHKVYVIGANDIARATSNEIHVPLERAVEAIDTILELARENEKDDLFHTAPLGVRFIRSSRYWLSMEYDRDSCSIEVPMLVGTPGAYDMLDRIERALYGLGGRPHWGQHNVLTREHVGEFGLYPNFDRWLQYYRRFNQYGTFENKFTKRMNFPSVVERTAE